MGHYMTLWVWVTTMQKIKQSLCKSSSFAFFRCSTILWFFLTATANLSTGLSDYVDTSTRLVWLWCPNVFVNMMSLDKYLEIHGPIYTPICQSNKHNCGEGINRTVKTRWYTRVFSKELKSLTIGQYAILVFFLVKKKIALTRTNILFF